ncbi:MAG: molybdenum cofactor guanylyltransferase MobA [Alphaproteobacteria bacterium]|nr:MAG: molybdenum cofactor guanylyltransferase MobA [Alphaproteobacteria bacterium]
MRPGPLGVIIAGGQSRRFQDSPSSHSYPIDKFLAPFGGTTLLGHIIHRARKQLPDLMLNVNGDPARVAAYGLDIIGDEVPDAGPLGGILATMTSAEAQGYAHIITFSSDSPFFPGDYVAQLRAVQNMPIAIARSGDKIHPVMGLFAVSLRQDLAAYLEQGDRRVRGWIARHSHKEVVWDNKNPDPFFNINRIEDLEAAEQYLSSDFK